jgi:hypothetical protein
MVFLLCPDCQKKKNDRNIEKRVYIKWTRESRNASKSDRASPQPLFEGVIRMRPARDVISRESNKGHVLIKLMRVAAAMFFTQAAFYIRATAAEPDSKSPTKLVKIAAGQNQTLNVIEIDLSGGSLELAHVTSPFYPKRESFDEFMKRARPSAAINGCFFDMDSGKLVGHVYLNGAREIEGAFSAAFAIGADNKPVINTMDKLGDTSKYKTIIACVDILMKDGKILVNSKADLVRNGHDPSRSNDIYKPARLSAIGADKDGKVYLIATNAKMTIYTFVKEVKEHTCITDLLGLDGGSSSGLFYQGQVIVRPVRTISSVIVVRPAPVAPSMIASR